MCKKEGEHMSRYSKIGSIAPCGSADSKYFGKGTNKLEFDIALKQAKRELFKKQVKELILNNPAEMDLRYGDTIEVLKELKEQYNL